jgi:hypothetical protein
MSRSTVVQRTGTYVVLVAVALVVLFPSHRLHDLAQAERRRLQLPADRAAAQGRSVQGR